MKHLYVKQLKDELEQLIPPLKNHDLVNIIDRGIQIMPEVSGNVFDNSVLSELYELRNRLSQKPESPATDVDKIFIHSHLSCLLTE
jgi:hypothetical protein